MPIPPFSSPPPKNTSATQTNVGAYQVPVLIVAFNGGTPSSTGSCAINGGTPTSNNA